MEPLAAIRPMPRLPRRSVRRRDKRMVSRKASGASRSVVLDADRVDAAEEPHATRRDRPVLGDGSSPAPLPPDRPTTGQHVDVRA